MYEKDQLEKFLNLKKTFSASNYVLFDSNGKIKKYESELAIMEEFYAVRLGKYQLRKSYIVSKY